MFKTFSKTLLAIAFCGLLGMNPVAAEDSQRTSNTGETRPACVVDTARGTTHSASIPGTLTLKWDDLPLFIGCDVPGQPPGRMVLAKPRDGWVPASIVIDKAAIAFLDASPGSPKQRPDSVSVTLYPVAVEDYEAKNNWYNERRSRIEDFTAERQRQIYQEVTECKFVATCLDAEEELKARKAADLKELDQLRALIRVKTGALVLKTKTRTICLNQVSDTTWQAGACPADAPTTAQVEMTRIKVDGGTECIFRVTGNTWESRPCPD